MNELKFACPHCDQHIAGNEAWAGRQLNCPACGQSMTVPTPSRPSVTPPSPKRPPVPGPASTTPTLADRHQPNRSGRICGLATASTILSLLVCLAPLTSIAGVVCGHLARKKLRQDPQLRGAGLATTGLVAGYLFSVLAVIAGLVFILLPGALLMVTSFASETNGAPVTVSAPVSSNPEETPGNQGSSTASTVPMKDPVNGKVGPGKFTCDATALQGGWLRLWQGTESRPETKIQIVLFASNRELSGKTITVGPGTKAGITPHIHLSWKEGRMPRGTAVSSGYQMTLRFEPFAGNTARGYLELEMPGTPKVSVQGNFAAEIR